MRLRRYSFVFFVGVVILGSIGGTLACRSASESNDSREVTGTPGARPTPVPTAWVEDGVIISPRGYRAPLPDGWNLVSGYIQAPDFTVDAIFAPSSSAPEVAKPNISITCRLLGTGENVATEDVLPNRIRAIEEVTGTAPSVQEITLSDEQAFLLSYSQRTKGPADDAITVSKVEAIQRRGECVWLLTVTFLEADRAISMKAFEDLLSHFVFTP